MVVAKKATAVVDVVSSIADAALGSASAATSSVEPAWLRIRAFFHLSTATKISSAPRAEATNNPMKFRNGKLVEYGETKQKLIRTKRRFLCQVQID